MAKPVCVVAGVGPGNGAAIARRFAADGFAVALLARNAAQLQQFERDINGSRAYACDLTNADEVSDVFARVARELGAVEVLVYNAGAGVWGNVEQITPQDFEQSWRTNAFGLLLAARQVIPAMRAAGKGSIIVIGATASLRGGAGFAAFAPAKAAQRNLAQSLARHLGPQGIHVACVVIDGVVDLPRTRERMKDKPDDFFLKPEDIAESVLFLARQPSSAWTFELDVRPFGEKW